jgi:hypothetical protein
MSLTATLPAPARVTFADKLKKFLGIVNNTVENVTINDVIPLAKKVAPPIANMAANIINCDIHMVAAVGSAEASAPAGASKLQRGLLVAGAIENQLLQDAASFGKDISGVIPQLIGYQQDFLTTIANAPNLTTAPTLAQIDAAETAAGVTAA